MIPSAVEYRYHAFNSHPADYPVAAGKQLLLFNLTSKIIYLIILYYLEYYFVVIIFYPLIFLYLFKDYFSILYHLEDYFIIPHYLRDYFIILCYQYDSHSYTLYHPADLLFILINL